MIPLKLRVRNFLCYLDNAPVLDLEGVTVACLCGDNGHGKSALLDAVTWALWGKARGIPNPARGHTVDELIHYGQDEMLVELEFLARGNRYRVVRRHSRGKGSRQGASDLQLLVSSGEGWRPITANTISQTQARIEQLIGLDYETFINSAFLVQGRADEFTTKPPEKRKEVLASIMGLGLYDQLEAQARQRAAEKEREQADAETRLSTLKLEVGRRAEYESALADVRQQLAHAKEMLDSASREAEAFGDRVKDLRRRQAEAHDLRRAIAARDADLGQLRQQVQAHQKRIQDFEGLLVRREEIVKRFAELEERRKRLEVLDKALSEHSALQQLRTPLALAIQSAESALREQARSLESKIAKDLQPKAERFPDLEQALAQAKERLELLVGEQEEIAKGRATLQEQANRQGELRSELARLKQEGQELRAKLKLLEASPEGARCPLCNSLLGTQEYRHLTEAHQKEIDARLAAYRNKESELAALDAKHATLEREVKEKEQSLRRRQQEAQRLVTSLEHQFVDSCNAAQELDSAREELAELRRRLSVSAFAQEERTRLAELDARMASLAYDAAEHERVRQSIQELRPYEETYRKLLEAEASLPQEQDALARTLAMVERAEREQEESRRKLAEVESAVADLPKAERELKAAEERRSALDSQQKQLLAREGELAGRLRRVEEAEQESREQERRLKEAAQEVALYRELAQAFGSRGVQAMLIEAVLPDLEREANELLARMTQNRMNVKLETQREAKARKGESIETLEIKVADELGTRSYELYSGGEAFRINLALRIALSRILAQRSGAPLPTLFIDEGFGTQDAAGREAIVEVIRAIEPLFQKIVVITHLDEVKDAFPVRIEVRKVDGASTFTVT